MGYREWLLANPPPAVRLRINDVDRIFTRAGAARPATAHISRPPHPGLNDAFDARVSCTEVRRLPEFTDDTVALSLSLRDILSQRLIQLPVVGVECVHTQAFDALVYIRVNERAGLLNPHRWKCPCCGIGLMPNNLIPSPLFCAALLRLVQFGKTPGQAAATTGCDRLQVSGEGWWRLESGWRNLAAETIDLTVENPDLGIVRVKVEEGDEWDGPRLTPPRAVRRKQRRLKCEAGGADGVSTDLLSRAPSPAPERPPEVSPARDESFCRAPESPVQEEQQQQQQRSSSGSRWSCPACTFLNEATSVECEMCGTKPVRARRSKGGTPASSESTPQERVRLAAATPPPPPSTRPSSRAAAPPPDSDSDEVLLLPSRPSFSGRQSTRPRKTPPTPAPAPAPVPNRRRRSPSPPPPTVKRRRGAPPAAAKPPPAKKPVAVTKPSAAKPKPKSGRQRRGFQAAAASGSVDRLLRCSTSRTDVEVVDISD